NLLRGPALRTAPPSHFSADPAGRPTPLPAPSALPSRAFLRSLGPGWNGTALSAVVDEKRHEKPGGIGELECEKNNTIPAGYFTEILRAQQAPSTGIRTRRAQQAPQALDHRSGQSLLRHPADRRHGEGQFSRSRQTEAASVPSSHRVLGVGVATAGVQRLLQQGPDIDTEVVFEGR